MTSYAEKLSRRRRREDDGVEIEAEEGEYSSGEEGEEEEGRSRRGRSSRKHSHHHKKRHHKKEKKKKKHRKRSPSRKRAKKSPENDTDDGGATTPEVIDLDGMEEGEISSPKQSSSPPPLPPPPPPPVPHEPRSSSPPPRIVAIKKSTSRSSPPPPSSTKKSSSHSSTSPSATRKSSSRVSSPPRPSPKKPPPRSSSPPQKKSRVTTPPPSKKISESTPPIFSETASESLSVEDTNKLRAKLGLAPLKTDSKPSESLPVDKEFIDLEVIPNSLKGERHRPPQNIGEVSRTEKIRRKLKERREKRKQEAKLLVVKGLGESDGEDEGSSSWIKRQERIQKEKEAAAKREKMLEELDDEFEVGTLVNEEMSKDRSGRYGKADLKGLKVQHSAKDFSEGKSVILTLKDSDILDENEGDTLVNVNMIDDERAKKNIENAKKAKQGYNPYDQELVDEETGEVRKKNMLDKYDEEIDGEKKNVFKIGSNGTCENIEDKKNSIREKLQRNLVSLELPEKKIASDYYTPSEVIAFKKTKKKKKVKRRILKADDLINMINETESPGSKKKSTHREMEEQDIGDVKDLSEVSIITEEKEAELSEAEKLKQKIRDKLKKKSKVDIAEEILISSSSISQEPESYSTSGAELIGTFADDEMNSKNIILNETSEFCRNLGAWTSSYGHQEYEKESSVNILDEFEDSLKNSSTKSREERWKEVEVYSGDDDADTDREDGNDKPKAVESVTILDEEPNLVQGVGAAIKMAVNKGYWESDIKKTQASNLKHLMSQNYFIEDKIRDDDRSSRRQDRYGGPTVPFQEKKDYIPNVKLEYIDDSGRKLNSKEAFRYLSHKFHGKGSGKLKTEKRMKKAAEESMMKNMSSTDTPLGTVEKMLKKQKESSTPYLVISGKNNQHPDLRK